jgi:hypothetical protein
LVLPACNRQPVAHDDAKAESRAAITNAANAVTAAANAVVGAAASNTAAAASNATAGATEIASKKDGLEFSYKWPPQAAAIPKLDTWFRSNAETLRSRARKAALADKEAAGEAGFDFRSHSYQEAFSVVADTPLMLVLLSEGYSYTGGAHGMPISTAVIWDKGTDRRLAITDLIDIPALVRSSGTQFCAELDRQREKKRGAPVVANDPNALPEFSKCVDMAKQLILPISHGAKALDTIRVVIGPYEAGPYAEGSYVIDLPVNAAMLSTVKPAYRDAFAVR